LAELFQTRSCRDDFFLVHKRNTVGKSFDSINAKLVFALNAVQAVLYYFELKKFELLINRIGLPLTAMPKSGIGFAACCRLSLPAAERSVTPQQQAGAKLPPSQHRSERTIPAQARTKWYRT
jgi:hypothetical protein